MYTHPLPGILDAAVDNELHRWRIATEKDEITKAWSDPMAKLSLRIIFKLTVTGIKKKPESRFLHKKRLLAAFWGSYLQFFLTFCINLSSAIPHMAEKDFEKMSEIPHN